LTFERIDQGLNRIGNIEFVSPLVSELRIFKLSLKATHKNRTINENEIDLFVVPKDLLENTKGKLSVVNESLSKNLRSLGIRSYPPEDMLQSFLKYSSSFL